MSRRRRVSVEELSAVRASAAGVERRRPRSTTAAPASAIHSAFACWWLRRGVRIGDEDRRPPGRRDLEDRAAGPREHQVGGGEGVGQARARIEQRVALGRSAARRCALGRAPRSRGCRRCGGRGSRGRRAAGPSSVKASSAQRLIERAPWLPPKTSRQRSSAAIPNRSLAPRRSAVPTAAGTGRPVTRYRSPSRPSIGNARHTRRARRASRRLASPRWRSASVSTSGSPQREGREAGGARDVAAAAQDRRPPPRRRSAPRAVRDGR